MTKEQIKELESLSKESLIFNLVSTNAQLQAVLAFAEYQAEQLTKQNEPIQAYPKVNVVDVTESPQAENDQETE
ncbi:hypothetical protein [Flavobacterium daemonense]|uniref:hypothetical protein n=1 Tax=Flavobacterium daemonense TaxID=1393049 RepID=UPI001185CE10|nr:hypothetical protein [Flavobacterium daemonense]KAF2337205.1 hypothetical protein FND99_01985 [Flavobacterium daemonense]